MLRKIKLLLLIFSFIILACCRQTHTSYKYIEIENNAIIGLYSESESVVVKLQVYNQSLQPECLSYKWVAYKFKDNKLSIIFSGDIVDALSINFLNWNMKWSSAGEDYGYIYFDFSNTFPLDIRYIGPFEADFSSFDPTNNLKSYKFP